MKPQSTLNAYIQQAIVDNWDTPALSNFKGETILYKDVARKIAKIHLLFDAAEIKHGDKIAFCGHNSAQWCIALLATLTYGAVAVPILNDFQPETIQHLVNHSEARALFADESIIKKLDTDSLPQLVAIARIEDYEVLLSRSEKVTYTREHLNELFGQHYPNRFKAEDVHYTIVDPEDTILINYTAGSTGFSKGVMIPDRAIWSNIQYTIDDLTYLKPGDNMLSLLPLAHMYGLTVELLHPLVKGCHVVLLNRTPSPKILLEAFSHVRPKLIVVVPLVLEKIIKTRVFPKLHKPLMRLMLHIPFIRKRVDENVRKTLIQAFGGNLIEFIVGGAAMSREVEEFLLRIHFPLTIGYGMTECAPLITYVPWNKYRAGSVGVVVPRMELRIDSDDPTRRPGILWVRGKNVMKGYFKNEEATKAVMRNGWMSTGDICQIDDDGYLYIRGRDKNMILGPSGQNIYPEEIEAVITDSDLVGETIVIDDNGKIVALVHPDYDALKAKEINPDDDNAVRTELEQVIANANKRLPGFSRIAELRIYKNEFEKTPKRSIKRYLYQ